MSDELDMETTEGSDNADTTEVSTENTDTASTNEADGENESGNEDGDQSDANAEGETESEGTEGEGEEGEAAAAAYEPNLKYKTSVFNKETKALEQKEFEIDKRFAPIMQDEESEKAVRELHEKAAGLDTYKERLRVERTQRETVSTENFSIKKDIGDLRTIYQRAANGNPLHMDRFFSRLKMNPEVIINYVAHKLQLQEMDPAQRNALVNQVQAEERVDQLASQQTDNDSNVADQARQLKSADIELTFMKPQVTALEKAYDEQTGKPGSFRNGVIRIGELEYLKSKGEVDLTAAEAVEKFITDFKLTEQPQKTTVVTPGTKVAGTQQANGQPAKKIVTSKTIPNVGSRPGSPLQGKPKSIDDLIKIRQERYG